jgi:acyl-CoA thioesterase-2
MLSRLAIKKIANCDVFTGNGIPTSWGRLYGGQAVTQSLMAAQATIDNENLFVHSLHGYFILAGDPKIPILFEVERVRDGKSFATRSVKAIQANRSIFIMTVSFHCDEPGPSYQIPLKDVRAYLPESRAAGKTGWVRATDTPSAAELIKNGRVVSNSAAHTNGEGSKWINSVFVADGDRWTMHWFKINHDGEEPLTRAQESVLLAYLSDMQLVSTVRQPHGQDLFSMSISLDHSIYFHRRLDPTQWLLCFCETSTSSGARGVAKTQVFQNGIHVATISQEALVRVPKSWVERDGATRSSSPSPHGRDPSGRVIQAASKL